MDNNEDKTIQSPDEQPAEQTSPQQVVAVEKEPGKKKLVSTLRGYLQLFLLFFKIGLFTFGGGTAMIVLIQTEICDKRNWLTADQMMRLVSVAESTPGPIAINTATYVGVLRHGILGGLFAVFGAVLPSFVIIFVISQFLEAFKSIELVQYAFLGIRAGVAVLILKAAFRFFKQMKKNVMSFLIMSGAFFTLLFTSFSSIYILLIAAGLGLCYYLVLLILEKRRAKP